MICFDCNKEMSSSVLDHLHITGIQSAILEKSWSTGAYHMVWEIVAVTQKRGTCNQCLSPNDQCSIPLLLTFCYIGRSLWILTFLPVTLLLRGYPKLIPFNKIRHFLQPTAKTTQNKPPPRLRNKTNIFQPLMFRA